MDIRFCRCRGEITKHNEELAMLTGVEERLLQYSSDAGQDADAINSGHRQKAIRDREQQALTTLQEILQQFDSDARKLTGRLLEQIKPVWDRDFSGSPNRPLVQGAFERVSNCGKEIDELVAVAHKLLADEREQLQQSQQDLRAAHSQQELVFR